MARTKAERERDREDLLLAIDELGTRADVASLALAVDRTYGQVNADLNRMARAKLVRSFADRGSWMIRWVRADSTDAALDVAEDLQDIRRQVQDWELAP